MLPGGIQMKLRIATLIALTATLVSAAPKSRGWQTGTLLDAEHNAYFGPGYSSPSDATFADAMTVSKFHFGNLPAAGNCVLDRYVIESDTYVYLVERMRVTSSKEPPLLAKMNVKFAVERNKIWLLAGDGKELQTNIVRQKAKLQSTQ
jgi:hypothetical protein